MGTKTFSVLSCLVCLIFLFGYGLTAALPNQKGLAMQRWSGAKNVNEMNYDKGDDCGTFLDPCGGAKDPPCCPPCFCENGSCLNSTLPAIYMIDNLAN